MAQPSPAQLLWRRRIETGLAIVAPALDLVLAAGDRLSRAVEREDLDWVPPRKALPNVYGPGTGSADETNR
jgi:hypothetical protein